ncbi:MAG: hypothetical protein DHS20C15_14920 [Planctomycetota bacterium]|nr:MAG: hypothetical protein DHS20C15_14920 [Planctomycetota bacterium]
MRFLTLSLVLASSTLVFPAFAAPVLAVQQAGALAAPVDGEAGARAVEMLGTSLESSLEAVQAVFDRDEAYALMERLDPYYRVRGNQGYMRSLEHCYRMLEEAGFADPAGGDERDTVRFEDYGPVQPAWTPVSASLEVISPDVGGLHKFENEAGLERTFLAVNSFPTGPEGVVAPLVRFEHSKPPESYAGTVVYGDLPGDLLFQRAVQQGGALGVISGYLPEYNDPSSNQDAIRYSKVPYDPERRGFGLNLSPAKRTVVKRLLGGGMVYVRVSIDARFADTRSRTLVARVAGTDPHAGTIALVAHLDEPGANDNASGVATTCAMAAGYLRALRDGTLARPQRSITFLVGTEFECSREWLRATSDKVDMALIIDMVGEDEHENGAYPLVERMPDPGAIWDRPPLDIHSEWGRGDVRESDLQGSFANDYVMAAMGVRRTNTNWNVRSNPYEGGSDHESFLERGVPAVLLWHFTDPYYHTSLDRADKVSAIEMEHVAVSTLGLVNHFAQAGLERAHEVLDLVMAAARHRLEVEARNAATYLSAPAVADDPGQLALVADRERAIIVAWSHWYREAVLSLEDYEPTLDGGEAQRDFEVRLTEATQELRRLERSSLDSLDG